MSPVEELQAVELGSFRSTNEHKRSYVNIKLTENLISFNRVGFNDIK